MPPKTKKEIESKPKPITPNSSDSNEKPEKHENEGDTHQSVFLGSS